MGRSGPADWATKTLGQFVTLQRGIDLPDAKRQPGKVPVMGSFGITGWHNEARVEGPGVTVGRSGASFGVVTYSETAYWPLNTALYVKDFNGNDPRFAYYFLQTFPFKRFNSGSAQPSLNRNFVHPVEVMVPPVSEQRRIAAVLGALDDKIELNRKMNRTLEEMAQAIFKSWFIDFDGVAESDMVDSKLGRIPRGWEVGRVADIADLNSTVWSTKTAPRRIQYIDIGNVKWGLLGDYTDYDYGEAPSRARRILRHGDTIIGTVRPANGSYSLVLNPPPFATGSTGFAVLRPKTEVAMFFAYLWLTRKEFIDYLASVAHGSADPAVAPEIIHEAAIPVPPKHMLAAFHEMASPLMNRRARNEAVSRTLGALRDALLPKLISGEIRVPEAEAAVENQT